jgi:hypothetical protein
MRVLFAAVPQSGHILPLLPLAGALAGQGDEVVFATGPDAVALIDASGVEAIGIGDGFAAWWDALAARTRGKPGDGLPPERIMPYFTPRLFAEAGAADMVDELLGTVRDVRPDLVVHDSYCFAAPLVAAIEGVGSVHHTIGPAIDSATLELCTDSLSPLWRSFGYAVPPFAGLYRGLTVEVCPRSLAAGHPPIATDLHWMRPVALPDALAAADAPDWLRAMASRPMVYVTLGTFSNADTRVFRAALAALAGEAVNVVITVGRNGDPAALQPVPANVRLERFVPQALLLPHCVAVIHHAGSGTMFGALAHGLPQVAIPQGADNFVNARVLAHAGAGVRLDPGSVSESSMRSAIRKVLDDAGFAAAAKRLARDIAAMPPPAELAAMLRRRHTGAVESATRGRGSR